MFQALQPKKSTFFGVGMVAKPRPASPNTKGTFFRSPNKDTFYGCFMGDGWGAPPTFFGMVGKPRQASPNTKRYFSVFQASTAPKRYFFWGRTALLSLSKEKKVPFPGLYSPKKVPSSGCDGCEAPPNLSKHEKIPFLVSSRPLKLKKDIFFGIGKLREASPNTKMYLFFLFQASTAKKRYLFRGGIPLRYSPKKGTFFGVGWLPPRGRWLGSRVDCAGLSYNWVSVGSAWVWRLALKPH